MAAKKPSKKPGKKQKAASGKATGGKKPASKKKDSTKKSATKKPAAKKATTAKTVARQEFEVNKLVAIYWEQFGRGAKLPVDLDCFDRSVKLGALANVRRHLATLSTYGDEFRQAEKCSLKAGQQARKLAKAAGAKSISADIYEQAFKHVAKVVRRTGGKKKPAAPAPLSTQWLLCDVF